MLSFTVFNMRKVRRILGDTRFVDKYLTSRFSDNKTFCMENEENLQIVLDKTEEILSNYGTKLNKEKTMVILCSII